MCLIAEVENKVQESLRIITDSITIQDERLTNLKTLENTTNDISQNKTSLEILESFQNGLLDQLQHTADEPIRIEKNIKIIIKFEEYNILEDMDIGKLNFTENTQVQVKK
jgi:hypothetical protein